METSAFDQWIIVANDVFVTIVVGCFLCGVYIMAEAVRRVHRKGWDPPPPRVKRREATRSLLLMATPGENRALFAKTFVADYKKSGLSTPSPSVSHHITHRCSQ